MGRLVLPAILIDSNEVQVRRLANNEIAPCRAYRFEGYETKVANLETGDYSLEGFPQSAVERKSQSDAYACVGGSRRRFEDCLHRLAELERPAIVIECSLDSFATPPARTQISAAQAVGSFISWSAQYRIPVFFCPSRAYAERVTLRWLMAYYKHFVVAREAKSA